MKIINNNKIDLQELRTSITKPKIFKKSTDKFWDDDYISKQMLTFHLNPKVEAASKTRGTIKEETEFIIKSTGMDDKKTILDLGCGPGLYVKEFAKTGAHVTGIDLSERSINYANEKIKPLYKNTIFSKMNYLDISFNESFDIVTLIFYDFCALNTDEQEKLLLKIHKALRGNGVFIFDVVSENKKISTSTKISVCEERFWSPDPYIEILNKFRRLYPLDTVRATSPQSGVLSMNSTSHNPLIIIKNWIKRKLAKFIYPEINELIAIDIREAFKDHG